MFGLYSSFSLTCFCRSSDSLSDTIACRQHKIRYPEQPGSASHATHQQDPISQRCYSIVGPTSGTANAFITGSGHNIEHSISGTVSGKGSPVINSGILLSVRQGGIYMFTVGNHAITQQDSHMPTCSRRLCLSQTRESVICNNCKPQPINGGDPVRWTMVVEYVIPE